MPLKSLFQSIKIKRNKEATDEEKLQAIQLIRNMAHEMRFILMNINLINEMLSKTELHMFQGKTLISLKDSEYKALHDMLESITTTGTEGIATVDRILYLLKMQ